MKELKRYKSALWKYRICRVIPFLKWIFDTDYGFCYHFNVIDYTNDYYGEEKFIFSKALPTLYSLKPKGSGAYWFEMRALKPRIKLLKQAIKILKEE